MTDKMPHLLTLARNALRSARERLKSVDWSLPSLEGDMRRLSVTGWVLITLFVVGGTVWMAHARLEGATIALGVVGSESNRKSVAHLEGGIIRDILVREGEKVEAGQTLIRMDDTMAQATLDLLQGREDALIARQARLRAEIKGENKISFPSLLSVRADDPETAALMEGESIILKARLDTLAKQDAILKERIAKNRNEVVSLQANKRAAQEKMALYQEEYDMFQELMKDGLATRDKILTLKRKIVEAEGERRDLNAQIARAREAKSEFELQRTLNLNQHMKDVTKELQSVREETSVLREKIHAALDVLNRTEVKAPQDGTVVAMRVHTTGGIVQAGETLFDLVPEKDRHVIELKIDPKDIDEVYPGMKARVRLTAFNARTTPMIEGRVTQVSADRMTDPGSNAAYFTGRVLPDSQYTNISARLTSGMQAEVFLVTAERTVLDYLLDPLIRSMDRAAREL